MRKIEIAEGYNITFGCEFEIRHFGSIATKRHGLCKWWYSNGNVCHEEYCDGKSHGVNVVWDFYGNVLSKSYYIYNEEVSEEEYRKHELIEELAGINGL